MSGWRPGDLVLVSAIAPNRGQKAIVSTQRRGGFADEDARWQHAAVYLGDLMLCEATLRGVRHGFIYPYVLSSLIRVRRDPSCSSEQGWRIALTSILELRKSYGMLTAANLWWRSRHGWWQPWGSTARSRSVICSQLYTDAFTYVTQRALENAPGKPPTTPAALSASKALQDLPATWLEIG